MQRTQKDNIKGNNEYAREPKRIGGNRGALKEGYRIKERKSVNITSNI